MAPKKLTWRILAFQICIFIAAVSLRRTITVMDAGVATIQIGNVAWALGVPIIAAATGLCFYAQERAIRNQFVMTRVLQSALCVTVVGLSVILLSLRLIFAASNGHVSLGKPGIVLFFIGLLTFLVGLAIVAIRPPTRVELANRDPDNIGTWQLRYTGLFILVLFIALSFIEEKAIRCYFPCLSNSWRHLIIALPAVALMSLPRVRNLVFYTGKVP